MKSSEIRNTFLEFFKTKGHAIVPSAPMVIKNDPTLMFTNAGMNQFKDIFLGNAPAKNKRVADTQKCLRVSGKHNDLEEVGVDTYHHTMFEMLGNWSFGDYFKAEAIEWAWDLLANVYKIPADRIYVTVFEGSKEDQLAFDQESYDCWKKYIAQDRILNGSKKDNFWEMGDTGPCGPCSEIHVDLRDDDERKKLDAKTLINNDHPQVIEIWNNVFMEFNRKADGSLEKLPAQHVDTGMGFERLCMVLQGKKSNYDTDVFQPMIQFIEKESGKKYKENEKQDIAMRVMSDHIRAIAFAIADGQLPSNNKAGYVIRRILRRSVRYAYTFLELKEPFLYQLVSVLAAQMGEVFPELKAQQGLIEKVIKEEETSFLRTLGIGIQKFEDFVDKNPSSSINGGFAFELFDTFGFPIDLTQLLAREKDLTVDMKEFYSCMEEQKTRSRSAAAVDAEDWVELKKGDGAEFIGYDRLEAEVEILKYRRVKAKGKDQFQLVLNPTPFYAEGGGQVGDTGFLESGDEKITITDTKKESGAIIHFADKLPSDPTQIFNARVSAQTRLLTENNHTATHLMHAALREVLGTHVEQKGSLVSQDSLRFDFSHFAKVTDEEIAKIEAIVNQKIRENIPLEVRVLPVEEAKTMGAMALFGEKYGDMVRVVTFNSNYSIELCGGTHVAATGQIGFFKVVSEAAVAAGVRRIEALTAVRAEEYINSQLSLVDELKEMLKTKDLKRSVEAIIDHNAQMSNELEILLKEKVKSLKNELKNKLEVVNGVHFISEKLTLSSPDAIKDLAFQLKGEVDNLFLVFGAIIKGKPNLSVMISENLVKEKGWNANNVIRELAKDIQGGGGGQAFYATAGGNNPDGLEQALKKAREFVK